MKIHMLEYMGFLIRISHDITKTIGGHFCKIYGVKDEVLMKLDGDEATDYIEKRFVNM
jgi:hypothetical protein